MRTPPVVSKYLSDIGRNGGKASGRRKRRPVGHYKRIGKLSSIARKK